MAADITAIILTKNEEVNIEECCVIILICVSVDTFQMKFIVAFFVKVILAIISYIIILVVLHHTIALKVIEFIRNCLKK